MYVSKKAKQGVSEIPLEALLRIASPFLDVSSFWQFSRANLGADTSINDISVAGFIALSNAHTYLSIFILGHAQVE